MMNTRSVHKDDQNVEGDNLTYELFETRPIRTGIVVFPNIVELTSSEQHTVALGLRNLRYSGTLNR
jgi:hypothetical protein